MKRRLVPILLFFLLLVPATGHAAAPEVKFRVRVLLASKQGDHIDPQIGPRVREYLKKSFGARYTSFRQLDNRVMKVQLDQVGEMPLPDQSSLSLKFREIQGDFVRLTMEVKDLRTTIRIRDGGLFFQAGHRYKNGILILAISANLVDAEKSDKEKLTTPRPEPRPGRPEQPVRDRAIEPGIR